MDKMVQIQIDDKYWLISDEHSWKIGIMEDMEGEDGKFNIRFKPMATCTGIANALETYYSITLRASEAVTWNELKQDSETIKYHIYNILSKIDKLSPDIVKELELRSNKKR